MRFSRYRVVMIQTLDSSWRRDLHLPRIELVGRWGAEGVALVPWA